ncbi:MAG: hypothetical protein O9972_45045 [Burkholderiales bacterium]|jgi:hypothetical protein|nr:hypothetical protein [Burkholderiales bacterium]
MPREDFGVADWMWWVIAGISTAPIWGAFLWHTYEFRVRPLNIPRDEMDLLVAAMLEQDDPEEAAFIEEQAAWYRSDTFEQGKWRRVRRILSGQNVWKA